MKGQDPLATSFEADRASKSLVKVYGKAGVEEGRRRMDTLASGFGDRGEAGSLRFYSAPGRTELAGNHTDHNRGKVLCAAVHLDALACVLPVEGREARLSSAGFPDPVRVDLDSLAPRPEEKGTTAALLRGVVAGLSARGLAIPGFEARVDSRVLVGSGLSSSAAIEVLLAVVMADLAGAALPPLELARIGQAAENEYFGKPCGLMDQAASASGGIVAFDFRDPASPLALPIDFDFSKEGLSLVVVNTGGSHADLTDDYAALPAEMKAVARALGAGELRDVDPAELEARGPELRAALGDRPLLRALHFFDENERVTAMVEALRRGRVRRYLKLVRRSGDSSWKLLQNLSTGRDSREQGLCLALALTERFLGGKGASRVHGGGFAGTIQAYLPAGLEEEYRRYMEPWFGEGSVISLAIRGPGGCRLA